MENLKNKDGSLKQVIDAVYEFFGEGYFKIVDYWEADKCSIGLKKDHQLIYISTWDPASESCSGWRCFYSFEIINGDTGGTIKIVKEGAGTIDDLITELKRFLGNASDMLINTEAQ